MKVQSQGEGWTSLVGMELFNKDNPQGNYPHEKHWYYSKSNEGQPRIQGNRPNSNLCL